MEPLKKVTGIVAPLDMANVDTDQVIPKQFLKRIERTGFGEFAFFNWRYLEDGVPNPDFILNQAVYQNAPILVAGPNFGSGSSREHAPWALKELGFMAIIAPSFGDIFRNNCFQNGMAPVILSQAGVDTIMARPWMARGSVCLTTTGSLSLSRWNLSDVSRWWRVSTRSAALSRTTM